MKTVLLTLAIVLFASTALGAATMGLYFDYWPGRMAYAPPPDPVSFFDIYMYLHVAPYYVTALEYRITTPSDPVHQFFAITGVQLPENTSVSLGDPFSGHSVAFWPPINGYDPGYNLVCTYHCVMLAPCYIALHDYPLVVGAHPDSGELRGAYYPNMDLFPIIGLTSILCPEFVGVEDKSWGAIKSLYK